MKTVPASQCKKFDRYPNFHKSGSIRGMKERFYGKDAMLVRCGSYIYNVPKKVYNKI